MHYLRTHAGQGARKGMVDRQDRWQGRDKRHVCNIPFVASPQSAGGILVLSFFINPIGASDQAWGAIATVLILVLSFSINPIGASGTSAGS